MYNIYGKVRVWLFSAHSPLPIRSEGWGSRLGNANRSCFIYFIIFIVSYYVFTDDEIHSTSSLSILVYRCVSPLTSFGGGGVGWGITLR